MKNLIVIFFFFLFSCDKSNSELKSVLGKNINNKEVQNFINILNSERSVEKFSDCYFYSFKQKGIALKINNQDTIESIILYSEGSDNFRKYSGDLPNGLKFEDTRNVIEQKLGPPKKIDLQPIIGCYSEWKGLRIGYKNENLKDMDNRIDHIVIEN